jgi:glucose-1-phosphate thymidylyltransferase
MIHFPLQTLVRSGVQNILIVSSRQHSGQIIEHIGDGYEFQADVSYKVQDMDRVQLGIASALQIAEDYTKDEDFAVILGDNFFEHQFSAPFNAFCNLQLKAHSACFFSEVDEPRRFGVIEWSEGGSIQRIVEKPSNPPSNCAVTGLYLFRPSVYDLAKTLKPSGRGELEIVDILNTHNLITQGLACHRVSGFWSDMGTSESMQYTQEFLNDKG